MASINPTATSVNVIRPFAGSVNARAKSVPNEVNEVKRTATLARPTVARADGTPSPQKVSIARPDENTRSNGTAPNSAGQSPVTEPVDTSGISDRTDAVLEHTLSVLMNNGVTDADTLAGILGGIIEPLVTQDGVANPKAATLQYIQEMIEKAQQDGGGSGTDSIGLRASIASISGLDLEG